jgi:hypothetical protein
MSAIVHWAVTDSLSPIAQNLRKIDLRAVITEGIRALPVPVKWVSGVWVPRPCIGSCIMRTEVILGEPLPLLSSVTLFA